MIKIFSCQHIIFCFVTLFLINPIIVSASKRENETANELKNKAKRHEKNNEIYQAIYFYNQYLIQKPDDTKAAFSLAKLSFQSRDYENAYNWLDTVISRNEKKMEMAYYYRGSVCLNLERYDEAIESFTLFRKVFREKKDPGNLRRLSYNLIESAEWAKSNIDSLADVTIHGLGADINGPHIEFSPFPVDSSLLLYGSLKSDTTDGLKEIRKIYVAEKSSDNWLPQGEIEGPINHPKYHTGNAALSPDGERMYFTICRPNWQNKEICELYLSKLIEGKWSTPEKLPYPVNEETYTSTQPAIGINPRKGNDIIYFVSDREGSRGGMDIWYTEYNERTNEYREPRNLGRNINSYGDDCCPFIDNNTNALYFSSNGRNGFGGFDINRSTITGRSWTEGVALHKPINSSYDDTYFSTINGSEGFFTSNRPGSLSMTNGSCCDDIFYYKYNQCVTLPSSGMVFNITNKDVYDILINKYGLQLDYIEDNTALANIPVKLFLVDNTSEQEVFIKQTATDQKGKYTFLLERNKNYTIIIENYGYFDKRINVTTKEYNCDEKIDLKETGINFLPEITVRFNIYYEHDRSRLTNEAKITVDTMLLPLFDLYPTALVEIGSHTDNTGSDNYNLKLSQRRSESVVKYLIENGIDQERLVARGYGETLPIAPNENVDGSDNPEGRQQNRRTEFKIIGSVNSFYFNDDE